MNWLAIDIGGANIKVADGQSYAATHAFPLWRHPDRLTHQLRRIISEAPAADHLVATMTGELADCFDGKQQGVQVIVESLNKAADGRHTRVYTIEDSLVSPVVAIRRYDAVAAANWHVLARYCGRFMELGPALLIDVGSTTCDTIFFRDGLPVHIASSDTQRLISGELTYTGIQRSPVCAVAREVPYRDRLCPVAQELFATTEDVYVTLGELPEQSGNDYTADGRPATKRGALRRLARTICADIEQFNQRDAAAMAESIADAQAELLSTSMERLLQRHGQDPQSIRSVVISGHGDFLALAALDYSGIDCPKVRLSEQLGAAIARAATAHALAVFAQETSGP